MWFPFGELPFFGEWCQMESHLQILKTCLYSIFLDIKISWSIPFIFPEEVSNYIDDLDGLYRCINEWKLMDAVSK